MDGPSPKKSASLETLVIQTISNVNELKAKLNEIISVGKSYNYDVSSCLKSLLKSSDREIVLLTVQAVSELTKCEEKRETYANKDIIVPILDILRKDITSDNSEVIKHSCRGLGNLCCDCDTARNIILEADGITAIINLLERALQDKHAEIKMFASKMLLNFAIGGPEFSEAIVKGGLIPHLLKILTLELFGKGNMNDDMVSTALLLLSVINDNTPEMCFEPEINTAVLNVLKETSSIEISELCLDLLHNQAEHDSVKTLLANEKGVQLVCQRLELLVKKQEAGEINTEDKEVEAVMKQACDLVIIVLTGDEAMHILYDHGSGEVYRTMVRWLSSSSLHLLTTAVLAIGNFARQDDYCVKMMQDGIFDKLLDIFEKYRDVASATNVRHAALSAVRNLIVPVANKKTAAASGRAAPILLDALPKVSDHHVAYKLLAALRMLLDGQEGVAIQLVSHKEALAAVAKWGHAGEYAGAAGEAPRLLAWATRTLKARGGHWTNIVQVEGCVSSLINMLVVCHSVMQNEAILALTLLAIEALKPQDNTDFDYEKAFVQQLTTSEIGKHISVLIETNCAKMPLQVAENLLAFIDITCKKNKVASDLKEAKVHDSLQKFKDTRKDLSDSLKMVIENAIATISANNDAMDVDKAIADS
ncbi:rap1 GTPase-GDP dissociation stimulator 1-A [Phthorimaea operculella]|nr:rap1 GTPase-GDP dissociation stimulator 1-A [Phthorimaea operculella]